jgi:hypothetical protein
MEANGPEGAGRVSRPASEPTNEGEANGPEGAGRVSRPASEPTNEGEGA